MSEQVRVIWGRRELLEDLQEGGVRIDALGGWRRRLLLRCSHAEIDDGRPVSIHDGGEVDRRRALAGGETCVPLNGASTARAAIALCCRYG